MEMGLLSKVSRSFQHQVKLNTKAHWSEVDSTALDDTCTVVNIYFDF